MKIGYFKHWFRPQYSFIDFLRDELKIDVVEIDFKTAGYLDDIDVAIIEQNGFDDYIENDEEYVRNFVKRGGICCFMHQDYRRWAKYFLPEGIGYPILVNRYMETLRDCHSYLMPTVEEAGRALFSVPEVIEPEEMIYWQLPVNSFGMSVSRQPPEEVMTTALSCAINCAGWEILGSFQDCAIEDGALILQAHYGKGLYFINQVLFPESLEGVLPKVFAFWRKYAVNLFAHFQRFLDGTPAALPPRTPARLPLKRNYRTAIHVHALDWYGADTSLGVIQALMRHEEFDIATIAIKDAIPYGGHLDLQRYSDDKVMLLHGQEYHPFNWNPEASKNVTNHNTYHFLAMGIDDDAYTPRYTRSFFTDDDVHQYLRDATDYVHAKGGAICATHPYYDYWKNVDIDAVDHEPLMSLAGTDYEKAYLEGHRFAMMNSVDMWGVNRLLENPAANFVYIEGEATRESFVAAVRAGHTIAACYFSEADITLDTAIPGDEIPAKTAQNAVLHVHAKAADGVVCTRLRVYSGAELIIDDPVSTQILECDLPLGAFNLKTYVRVEIDGDKTDACLVSTPFYLN